MRNAIGVVVCLSLVACSPAQQEATLTDAVRAEVRDSVTAGLRGYEAAIESMDSARIAAYFSSDPAFRAAMGRAVLPREAVLAWAGSLRATLRSYGGGFTFDSLAITVLSPTSAAAVVPYEDIMTDTAGVVTTLRGTATWIWARTDTGWHIAGSHAVSDAPIVAKP